MRLAYSTLAYPRRTVEEAVPAAVRYGYHAIEWRLADGIIIDRGTPPTVRRRLCEVSAASGIAFACLDTSYRIVQASPEECVAVTEGVQRMIDMADELGVGCAFATRLRGPLPPGTTRSLLLAPTAEVLHTISTYAVEHDITVVLETHDAWSTSADVLQLLRDAASPTARVLWDNHHTYRAGEVPAQSVALLGTALAHVHVKYGCPRSNSTGTWEFCLLCLLNEGTVPLRDACTALRHSGYDGYLSLEWEKL